MIGPRRALRCLPRTTGALARLLVAGLLLGPAVGGCRPAGEGAPSAAGSAQGTAAGADVVLITIDTLRYDALGFTGNPRVETPVLDRLAAAGRRFTDVHAHNVVTLPSHANILTGLYPYQHGVRDNSGFVLGEGSPTLATWLRREGYATGAFVGAFPLDSRFGLDRDFDVYDDDYPKGAAPQQFVIAERRGGEVVARARRWWQSQEGKKRFLWVHLYDPHAPYAPAEPFASRFAGEPYLGEVAATDAYLAPLLEPLLEAASGAALVVMTSDHGEALGDHGELTHGLFAYEATLKVPLVLWGLGVAPGEDDRPAGHVDIAPTILAAVGAPVPPELPGRSLLAPAPAEPRFLYFEALSTYLNRGWAPLKGGLRGGDKWIDLPVPELYSLPEDPGEERNLVEVERRRVVELRRAMPEEEEWPPRPRAVSAEEAARLRSLGYVTGSPGGKERFTPEDDPKTLVTLDRKLHQVVDLYSRGRYPEAADLAREVVAERGDMAVGYQHLGMILRQMDRPGEAIEVLETALEQGVASSSLTRDLGLTLAEAGRAAEAIRILEPLASEEDLESLVALGNAYFTARRLDAARTTFERVLSREPHDIRALEGMGAVALAARQPDVARTYLERALSLDDALPIAANSLGVALYQLGDAEAAMAAWERAAELDPRQFDALFNLGLVAAERRQAERARRALSRFVATAPPERFGPDLETARRLLGELGG